MRTRVAGVLLAFCLGMVGTIQAQVAWDAPLMVPPAAEGGLGIFLIDAAGAGANVGVLGTWRARTGQPRMGLRFGIADRDGDDDLAVIAGADFAGTQTPR